MIRTNRSWTSYTKVIRGLTVAGTFAAGGAFVPSAHAGIIYTDVVPDLTMSTVTERIEFDLDHSGAPPYAALNAGPAGADFQLRSTGSTDVTTALSFGSRQIAGYYILKLASGATIDSSLPWNAGVTYFEFFGTGFWEGGADAYIGLRIQNGVDFNYGWAHLVYDDAGNQMTLKEFAYQTTANTPILAGDIGPVAPPPPPPAEVPEPSTLLLLALGAGGMAVRHMAKRRREELVA